VPFAPQQSTRRLTQEETNGLRVNMVMPVAVIAAIGVVALIMTIAIVVPNWDRPLIKWFFGMAAVLLIAVAIAVWVHVRNNAGDLRDGVAQVRTGRVLSKRRTGRAPYTFYATIDGTGELIVWGADYEKMIEQQAYTVSFSPRTRRVWTVESANDPPSRP
jgi:hypothetical protein